MNLIPNDIPNFEEINDKQKIQVYGKLKALEDIKVYIEVLQESFTRLLKVNGVKDEEEFKDTLLKNDIVEVDDKQSNDGTNEPKVHKETQTISVEELIENIEEEDEQPSSPSSIKII
jgi:hypothetical protein